MSGLRDVAFARCSLAHALIRGIHVLKRYRANVFTAADLVGVNPIRAVSGLAGFKVSVKDLTNDAFTLETCSRINISARHGSRAMIAS